jgi:hypothetical protein
LFSERELYLSGAFDRARTYPHYDFGDREALCACEKTSIPLFLEDFKDKPGKKVIFKDRFECELCGGSVGYHVRNEKDKYKMGSYERFCHSCKSWLPHFTLADYGPIPVEE